MCDQNTHYVIMRVKNIVCKNDSQKYTTFAQC
jgi:hypothetical protein